MIEPVIYFHRDWLNSFCARVYIVHLGFSIRIWFRLFFRDCAQTFLRISESQLINRVQQDARLIFDQCGDRIVAFRQLEEKLIAKSFHPMSFAARITILVFFWRGLCERCKVFIFAWISADL